jgi:hypothetical protein
LAFDRPVRQQQIEAPSRELAELEVRVETVQKTESRLERLIEGQMVRLDPDKDAGVRTMELRMMPGRQIPLRRSLTFHLPWA